MRGYSRKYTKEDNAGLEVLLKAAKTREAYRRIQAVYCRTALNMPVEEISRVTGYSMGTIYNLHSDFLRRGEKIFEGAGRLGGNNRCKTEEEEASFIARFDAEGDAGGILEVKRIHEAHCIFVGRKVALSTTYKLLNRHGWRKIAPRPRHPQTNEEAQASFKKTGQKL